MLFPTGTDPFTFSDSLSPGSHASDAPIGAQHLQSFTTIAPTGQMYVTFVIFAYPNADNGGPAGPPLVPIVEILTQPLGLEPNPWQILSQTQTSGESSISLADPDQFLDYTYTSLGQGVFQIAFQQNDAPFDNQNWSIRFTISDGVTSPTAQTGLTFTLDSTPDTLAPWIAVPAQPPALPPAPIDYCSTIGGWGQLSLAGSSGRPTQAIRAGGHAHVIVPIGNYGTAPLILNAVDVPSEGNGFSAQFPASPVTIAPGCVDTASLQISFYLALEASKFGTVVTTPPTSFSMVCNDLLAGDAGLSAHLNVISLYAICVYQNPI